MTHWKQIPGFPEYEISDTGLVKSHHGGKEHLLTPVVHNPNGGSYVELYSGGRKAVRRVARLVAEAFLPKPEGAGNRVYHIDGDGGNDHVENLRWATMKWPR